MKSPFTFKTAVLVLALLCGRLLAAAQITPLPQAADTVRIIHIIRGNSLREKTVDSLNDFQTIAGEVILKEGSTLFYCDSASINKKTNILEAFGNIHINQNDSINSYSQYLRYIGKDRMAYLKKDVRLTDNKGTLFTQELEYDLKSSIGKYFNGGKVVNGKTVLTSTEGTYYADTKDVIFKKNVHLVDPKYDMRNDTLLYNTQTQITSWNTPTNIKSKNGGDIYSVNGTYDLKNGKAFFGNRTVIKDSTRTYVANESAYDEVTGIAQLEGNAIIKDSVNGYSVLGNTIFLDKNKNTFLATRKPVLIFKGDANDSTFIAADTLFSGIERRDSLGRKISEVRDTLKKDTVVKAQDSLLSKSVIGDSSGIKTIAKNEQPKDSGIINKTDSLRLKADSLSGKPLLAKATLPKNSGMIHKADSIQVKADSLPGKAILVKTSLPKDSLLITGPDSATANANKKDSVATVSALIQKEKKFRKPLAIKRPAPGGVADDTREGAAAMAGRENGSSTGSSPKEVIDKDSMEDVTVVHRSKDTAIRYFVAFHHVRIFNDSLQSVCDSLYYSSEDSIFRLFQKPLVFSNNSQIAGDTIYMYTKNKKPSRLYVFENGIIINKANEKMYNQIAGRTLNGYFKGGELDYMRARGSPAESVYYPQDDDSAYIGMNRSKGDVIDVFFVNKAVNKVKFINDVDGTLFPIRQVPEEQKFLKNYKWLDSRRPKNKLELFE